MSRSHVANELVMSQKIISEFLLAVNLEILNQSHGLLPERRALMGMVPLSSIKLKYWKTFIFRFIETF